MSSTTRDRARLVHNLGVRTQIMALVAVVVIGASAVGLVMAATLKQVIGNADTLASTEAVLFMPMMLVHQNQLKARMLIAQVAAAPDDATKQEWAGKQAENDAEIAGDIARVEAFSAGDVPAEWDAFTENWQRWLTVRDQVLMPLALGDDREAFMVAQAEQADPIKDDFVDALDAAEAAVVSRSEALAAQSENSGRTAYLVLAIGLSALLGLVITGSVALSAILRRSLSHVHASIEALAAGDVI